MVELYRVYKRTFWRTVLLFDDLRDTIFEDFSDSGGYPEVAACASLTTYFLKMFLTDFAFCKLGLVLLAVAALITL